MAQKGSGIRIKPARRDKIRFNLMVVGQSEDDRVAVDTRVSLGEHAAVWPSADSLLRLVHFCTVAATYADEETLPICFAVAPRLTDPAQCLARP